jgi:hypothetical protein
VEALEYNHRSYSLFSMAVEKGTPSTPEEIRRLSDPVLTYGPDAVWLGEVTEACVTYLTQSLPSYALAEGLTADRVLEKENALSKQTAHTVSVAGVSVSAHWVGDEWNGFRVLRISGALTRAQVLSAKELATLLSDEPTVILIHTTGAALTVGGALSADLCAVLSEQIPSDGEESFFSCYATEDSLTVRVENGGSEDLYRSVTVERISAF